MLKGFSKFLLILCFVIFVTLFALAYDANAATSSSILVEMIPENPAPHESTLIKLSSYSSNLDRALINWSVNGKSTLSGVGQKTFSLNAPAAGATASVVATIALPEGSVTTQITVRPAVMVLLWQANDSYVPPFYAGKAMPSLGSEIKVVAMPELRNSSGAISSKNLTYDWKLDYDNMPDASGYSKNSFLYLNDYLEQTNNIAVTATSLDGKAETGASLDIGINKPEIIFYKSDKNLGTLWENALEDPHTVTGDEVIFAAPYFISPKEIRSPKLSFKWYINNSLVNILGLRKNVIPLTVETGTTGTSKLRLDIENASKIYSNIGNEIDMQF